MRYFLFVLLFICTAQVTTAVAKEEFWECGNTYIYVYKIDKQKPSVALRKEGEWKYYKNVVYDKENQNLSRPDKKGQRDVFDLLLKQNIYKGKKYPCKVIKF